MLHLKVLQEEIELVERLLAELRLQLELIVEVALDNREQLEEEARHAIQNVDVGDGVQRLDPLNEYNLTLFVDACLQFLANGVDQLIQVKLEALVERTIDNILELVVYFLRVLFDVGGGN